MKSGFIKLRFRIQEFINDSRAVGIILLVCTILSLTISNISWGAVYVAFWEHPFHFPIASVHLPHSMLHWVNDGLMAVFFLLVGMEIKREVLEGELSSFKKSILPIVAAIGGMLVPAALYVLASNGSDFTRGWGIPMATDIAFSLGILSLLGSRIPTTLKVFLTALAIIDDLGAIVAIAIFYTDNIDWLYLVVSGIITLLLFGMNKAKFKSLLPYFGLAFLLWYCLFNSGLHATLAGVILAMALPLRHIPALEHRLHRPVNFIILPLFALANTAILLPTEFDNALRSPITYGIMLGLVLGKPLGITLISFIAVKLKLATLPKALSWKHILGMGLLAGIGFTMSIFIAMLAFDDITAQTTAKLAVIVASLLSGLLGFIFLKFTQRK